MSSRILTLPNCVTVIRILLVPVFVAAIFAGQYAAALLLFATAALSDGLDGWLARKRNERTELGAFLDPLADKALLITAVVVLSAFGWIPLWLAVALIGRDLVIVLGYVFLSRLFGMKKVRVTWAGKTAIAAEMVLLTYVLVWLASPGIPDPAFWMFLIVAALSIGSGVHYIYRGFVRTNEHTSPC